MKRTDIIDSILLIATFMIAFYGKSILNYYVNISFSSNFAIIIYGYIWWLIPTLTFVGCIYGIKNILKEFRIDKGILDGLIFSFIAVLPMLLSSAIVGQIDKSIDISALIHKTIAAGFMEEYLFRGFLFGILFRKRGWGFIPASILGALIFGAGHIYQGTTIPETIGIFLITSVGAIWFSWLFIEWGENLWIPIFLHAFMNMSWILFDVSSNALGGVITNIFRFFTIALAIIITVVYNRKRGLIINRYNLILNKVNL